MEVEITGMTKSQDRTLHGSAAMAADIRSGNRRALSAAITLVESTRAEDQELAAGVMDRLARTGRREAVRIAVSGTPGAGKSTLINAAGSMLVQRGCSVAVLAIDPTSARTGGSILGDKTRMAGLAGLSGAYIRPSPNSQALGGVASRSTEAVFLCEQAGFDHVLIETVGVGQSETDASRFSDVFMLLAAPGGGDELQGIKRGIIELADLVVVNKADGELKNAALAAASEYRAAIRLLPASSANPPDFPKVLALSAIEEVGLDAMLDEIAQLVNWRKSGIHWREGRRAQDAQWLESRLRQTIHSSVEQAGLVRQSCRQLQRELDAGYSVYSPEISGELARMSARIARLLEESK